MKQFSTLALFTWLLPSTASATVHTVDNSPGSTGDFSDLQTAIDSAETSDTLIIYGSGINYGTVYLNSPLTLVGDGWCISDSTTHIEDIWLRSSDVRLFGLHFRRIWMDAAGAPGQSLEHVHIERCMVGFYFDPLTQEGFLFIGLNNPAYALLHDIVVSNSLIWNSTISMWGNDCLESNFLIDTLRFENNIFSTTRFNFRVGALGTNTLFIEHNLFLNGVVPLQWGGMFYSECIGDGYSISDVVISDNIFYASNPTGCTNCSYFNNLTYQNGPQDDVPETPGPNFEGQDPMFINYSGGEYSLTHDFAFQSGSPGIANASDGSDIGPLGGEYPMEPCVFDLPTGVTSNPIVSHSVVQLAPNPATSQVSFTLPGALDAQLSVADASGRVLLQRQIRKNERHLNTISVEHFAPGAYFVKLQGEDWQAHGRFIKE